MQNSLDNPSLFTNYFFAPYGEEKGFIFDDNFMEEGKWQEDLHSAKQKDCTIIGGFGTGKTLGVAMSASTWCALTSDFKFLNVAPRAWQSKLMYDLILLQARGTRFEDLIWEKPRKPYPKITLRYKISDRIYESSMEFMSADKNATGILSWEGDWLHVDEAGLLDNLEEVIINLGSRLRGTVRGRERLGRFSMTSNSWDNFYLWYYFDLAAGQPEHYFSVVVASRHNRNVTKDQLARMMARIPEDERDRFLEGARPEGRGRYFSRDAVYSCEVAGMAEIAEQKVKSGTGGYEHVKLYGAGIVKWSTPPQKNKVYMLFGDPGTDGPPKRNSPILMLWDVTEFPKKPAILKSFWWGNGGGRISPFIEEMFRKMAIYKPMYIGIDSTGTQKNMNELINEYRFAEEYGDDIEMGYQTDVNRVHGIHGLDFSGTKKAAYLQSCRLLIEASLFKWPKEIIGIRSQLTNYDLEKDRGYSTKIVQDIVATMAMSAYAIRIWFHVSPKELLAASTVLDRQEAKGSSRLGRKERQKRSTAGRSARNAYYKPEQEIEQQR